MAPTVAVPGTLIACAAGCLDTDPRSAAISDSTAAPASLAAALATTASGPVQGTAAGDLAIFRGIPYAAAPIGARRFAPPVPLVARRDLARRPLRDAHRDGDHRRVATGTCAPRQGCSGCGVQLRTDTLKPGEAS
jgi:hypothetical protein